MGHFSNQQISETYSADVDTHGSSRASRTAFNRARITEALKRIPPVCAACAQSGHTIQGCPDIRKELFR